MDRTEGGPQGFGSSDSYKYMYPDMAKFQVCLPLEIANPPSTVPLKTHQTPKPTK